MDGFAVNVDELRQAASRVHRLQRDFADSTSLKYSVAVKELGHDGLARALAEFHDESRTVSGYLCDVAEDAAIRLDDSAVAYADGDQASAEAIAGTDGRFRVAP